MVVTALCRGIKQINKCMHRPLGTLLEPARPLVEENSGARISRIFHHKCMVAVDKLLQGVMEVARGGSGLPSKTK